MKPALVPPVSGAAQQLFEIQRDDAGAPEAGQRVGGVQIGFPLWQLIWTLGNMGRDRTDAWRAFFAQLRGATRYFLAWDLARPLPKAYPGGFAGMTRAGGGSFDGTATSWSETTTADDDSQVTLDGLPAGFVLGQCDYIGFTWTATETGFAGMEWHAPVRVVEGGTADGSGVLTVTSEPPVPLAVPSGATAYLDTPKCTMKLITDQSNLGPIDRNLGIRSGQIAGIQDLRA